MEHGFRLREGTYDDWIFRSVVEENEYGLPERFEPTDVILDVGMHIGSFCHAAAIRGAGRVYGFEADEANYRCACTNLAQHGTKVQVFHKAAWRSDRGPTVLHFHRPHDAKNTGGGNVWSDGTVPVEAIPFDNAVRMATRNGRGRVRFLKIDCEGSEFPILFTSRLLHLIDEIAGEYHEFGGEHDRNAIPETAAVPGFERYTIGELTDFLQAAGFAVESKRYGESNLGIFRARQVATAPTGGAYRGPWLWRRLRTLIGR